MADFRKMVLKYLELKLGAGDHNDLGTRIMERADANKDSKVRKANDQCTLFLAKRPTSALGFHPNFFIILTVFVVCL